jgi:hypothetical protein
MGRFRGYRSKFTFSDVQTILGAPAFARVNITYVGKSTPYGKRHQVVELPYR